MRGQSAARDRRRVSTIDDRRTTNDDGGGEDMADLTTTVRARGDASSARREARGARRANEAIV